MFVRFFLLAVAVQIFLIFMPLILNLESSTSEEGAEVLRIALGSCDFKVILGSCISLSLPLVLEILRDCLSSRSNAISYHALYSNIILVLTLLLPDVIIFVWVLPTTDIRLFVCIHQCRAIAISSLVYSYLYISGGIFFKGNLCGIWYVFGCISNHFFLWQAFRCGPTATIYLFGEIFSYISGLAYCLLVILWLSNQYLLITANTRAITTNEYFCSVYIFSSFFCFLALAILWTSHGSPDFFHISSGLLVGYNATYAVFYVFVSVFHQGIVRRDLIVEVRSSVFSPAYHIFLSSSNLVSIFFLIIVYDK